MEGDPFSFYDIQPEPPALPLPQCVKGVDTNASGEQCEDICQAARGRCAIPQPRAAEQDPEDARRNCLYLGGQVIHFSS